MYDAAGLAEIFAMKLLFCPRCLDMFKLVIYEPRSCRCGYVRGHMQDNNLALVNGKGISLCIDNWSLVESGNKLPMLPQNNEPEFYAEQLPLKCYVRPHSGAGNPRSAVKEDLDSSADIAVLLAQAVVHYRQEHTARSDAPEWVDNAEHVLKTRGALPRFQG
jgi:hypothetical protein